MTVDEQEERIRQEERRLRIAINAYSAVWDTWNGLDAHSVDRCRRAAMAAALAAALSA